MKENIETKDVQKTEYLDKNGLDMLWAKVKENTHNQVEVERNRATTQEDRIIETKADKSELHSSYVSNSTFTALQEKVAANTDAISDKQDAGNYLSYETLNNEGYYEIPDIRISGSGGITKTDIDSQSISVKCDTPASHTTITCDGISNTDNNANHVYATDGSIADLTQYIKKGDTDVKFVPYVKKGLNQYNQAESYWLSNGLQFGNSQTNHTVIIPEAFDARCNDRRTNLSVDSMNDYAVDISNYRTSRSVKVAWDTMKLAFTTQSNSLSDATTYSLAGVRLFASLSSKKPENTLVLGTDEDYKEIGVDIAPLENGKVPAEYLDLSQYAKKSEITAGGNVDDVQVNGVSVIENKIANIKPATKENLGVVKVGDGLNVTDGTISVDTTAIGAGNYLPYEKYTSETGYDLPYNNNFWAKKTVDNYITSTVMSPGRVIVHSGQYDLYLGQNTTGCGVSVDYGKKIHSYLNYDSLIIYHYINNERYIGAKLNKEGIFLLDGDNNHVLTSNGSTIDITQYVLKSVYDEKIAALEARIAALEAKHTETA